jgi:hypothetical protein
MCGDVRREYVLNKACRLVVDQLWDSRIVRKGVSMHHGVLSRHLVKDLSLHARAIGRLFVLSSRSS